MDYYPIKILAIWLYKLILYSTLSLNIHQTYLFSRKKRCFCFFPPEYCLHLCLMLIPLSIDQLFQPIALILSSRKSKKKRERSNSSSSSSSSSFVRDEETKSTEKSLAQLQGRKCVESTETGQAHGGFVSLH